MNSGTSQKMPDTHITPKISNKPGSGTISIDSPRPLSLYNRRYVRCSKHCYEKSNNGVPALAGFYRGKRPELSDTLRVSGPER